MAPSHLAQWKQGRVPYLEQVIQSNLGKISTAMTEFRRWAQASGLTPSETTYLARTRDSRQLRFSASADPSIEQAYRTNWVSPELSKSLSVASSAGGDCKDHNSGFGRLARSWVGADDSVLRPR